jgi:hypothetical protein
MPRPTSSSHVVVGRRQRCGRRVLVGLGKAFIVATAFWRDSDGRGRCVVVGLDEAVIVATAFWHDGNGRGTWGEGARRGRREEELRLRPWWIEKKRSEVRGKEERQGARSFREGGGRGIL